MNDPLARLRFHYENRMAAALDQHQRGVPVVGLTSNTVPRELILAAQCFPTVLSPPRGATPHADPYMEPVFDARSRGVFDRIVAGDWSFLRFLVIPRTSEPEHKLYLYLREVARRGVSVPKLYLFDLLHTRSQRSREYGFMRLQALQQALEALTGRSISAESLTDAIRQLNTARRAIHSLLKLRGPAEPRITGCEALTAIGAWYFLSPLDFASISDEFTTAAAARTPLTGPRILIKGIALDHPGLHRAIESHGAIVVGEDDWWGSRSAGREIPVDGDPLCAIFEKYYLDAPSPRVFPPEAADEWFERAALDSIDGVVFYLPPDDDVLGWDYPRQKTYLNDHGIPSLRIREDAAGADVSANLHVQIEDFVKELAGRRHGRIA